MKAQFGFIGQGDFMGQPMSNNRAKTVNISQYTRKHRANLILNKIKQCNAYSLKPIWNIMGARVSDNSRGELMMYAELYGDVQNYEIKNS